jgi:hypothetical protein
MPPQTNPFTFEAVWASLQETDRILSEKFAESDRFLTEKFAESDRLLSEKFAKTDRFLSEKFAETDRQMKETAQMQKENERLLKESSAAHDRRMKEWDTRFEKDQKDYNKRMINMEKNMGNWSNNHGSFAEEYFFNSFDEEQQDFFGEHFNDIDKNLNPPKKQNIKDEYDIVMYNDSYVAIVETKFKAHEKDIPKVLKKAETFRILNPDYKDFKIYLGLATLAFYPELEEMCIEHGIAIIKQVGDTVVINDAHLKVY